MGKKDDLPQRDRTKAAEKMAQRRTRDRTGPNDFSVTGRTGVRAEGHPNGWQTGGRDENG